MCGIALIILLAVAKQSHADIADLREQLSGKFRASTTCPLLEKQLAVLEQPAAALDWAKPFLALTDQEQGHNQAVVDLFQIICYNSNYMIMIIILISEEYNF